MKINSGRKQISLEKNNSINKNDWYQIMKEKKHQPS